jgi:hypothetical protein
MVASPWAQAMEGNVGKSYGRSGRHYRYEPTDKRGKGALEFWAENGMVCCLDERYPERDPEHFVVLTRREFLTNLGAINASIERCAHATGKASLAQGGPSPGGAAAEEREALHRLVADGIACAREAKAMGDPFNPRHMAQMIQERRKHMLLAGPAAGAITQDRAPEASKLPPLALPGVTHRGPRRVILIP